MQLYQVQSKLIWGTLNFFAIKYTQQHVFQLLNKKENMMKKILAILALTISGSVFAGSISFEGQSLDGHSGSADQKNFNMTARGAINDTFTAHAQVSTTQTNSTNAVSTRLETGITGAVGLFGPVNGYTTVAIGEAYKSAGNFAYYSVEPGITAPIGTTGLTARLGYRYRTAFNNENVNNDTTQTARVGLSYAITKQDSVGVRYDKVTGDTKQNGYAVNYTRSF